MPFTVVSSNDAKELSTISNSPLIVEFLILTEELCSISTSPFIVESLKGKELLSLTLTSPFMTVSSISPLDDLDNLSFPLISTFFVLRKDEPI